MENTLRKFSYISFLFKPPCFAEDIQTTYFSKNVIGAIVHLKTQFLCKSMEQISSWDKTFNTGNYNDTVYEILLWKFNLVKYSNKVINCHNILLYHFHSDASNTGIACVLDVRGKENICYRNRTNLEKTFSFTWCELEATRFSFLSSIKQFENKCIFIYRDDFATLQIISCGSNKSHIHYKHSQSCIRLRHRFESLLGRTGI